MLERWVLDVYHAQLEKREFVASGDGLQDPPRSLGGGVVIPLPWRQSTLIARVLHSGVEVRHAVDVRSEPMPRLTFLFPDVDVVELALESADEVPRGARVRFVPVDQGSELLPRIAQGVDVPPFELTPSGGDPYGGRVFESVRSMAVDTASRTKVALRRGVDYHIVSADPRFSIEPPLMPAEGRVAGSTALHRLHARP
jgi:hypothetical protein